MACFLHFITEQYLCMSSVLLFINSTRTTCMLIHPSCLLNRLNGVSGVCFYLNILWVSWPVHSDQERALRCPEVVNLRCSFAVQITSQRPMPRRLLFHKFLSQIIFTGPLFRNKIIFALPICSLILFCSSNKKLQWESFFFNC